MATVKKDVSSAKPPVSGAFIESLKRNNTQIKTARAEAIGEDAEMAYRRSVEDMLITLKRLKRKQENMLDMSPENALSLKLATDFEAQDYVDLDLGIGVEIRNLNIKLEIVQERFAYLFGKEGIL